ncbi:substrate-binding periplasmic protein [Kiloniella sp.]|uniref:substrate-binding periplasmic protein n=1 Tax=Kiloniella sp. TaxID=1938587 RepID=UPI003B02B01C
MKSYILALLAMLLINTKSFGDEIIFGVTADYPPYEYKQDEEVKGLFIDIIRECFKRMGYRLRVEVFPWSRIIRMGKEGEIDIFVAFKTKERETYLDFSRESVMDQTISFFAHKNADLVYSGDLSEFQDLRIGVVKDLSYGTKFDEAVVQNILKNIEVHKEGDYSLKKLHSRRLDLIISNRYGARYL